MLHPKFAKIYLTFQLAYVVKAGALGVKTLHLKLLSPQTVQQLTFSSKNE